MMGKIVQRCVIITLLLLDSVISTTCLPQKNRIPWEILRRSKAADIKSWVDRTQDPCKNFYKFACGKWNRINSARTQDKELTAKLEDITESNKEKLHKWLNSAKTGHAIDDKLRDFYGSCRGIENNTELYVDSLDKVYQEFGQFSFLKKRNGVDSSNTDFNWWSTIAKMSYVYDMYALTYAEADHDIKGKNRTMIFINPVAHNFDKFEFQQNLMDWFDATSDEAEQMVDNMNTFYEALSQAGTKMAAGKLPEELNTLHNITDLQEQYKDVIDLESFLMISLNISEVPAQVYVYDKAYLDGLMEIVNDTDANTVEDFILWALVSEFMSDFTTDESADSRCASDTKRYFGSYIEHIIYEQYRSPEYEKEFYEMWPEIRSVLQDQLRGDHYPWMSNTTRQHALRKLQQIQLKINSYDEENFDDFFEGLHIDPLNYVANVQSVLRHFQSLRGDRLQARSERFDEVESNSDSPYFVEKDLKILYPVEFMQPYHIWHPAYPKALKYGTIGNTLAHEMMHAFDDRGRGYDAEGNANNWWDRQSNNEFEKRRRCFQAQYHNYIYGGKRLPDLVVQPENIADNAAVKIAYTAYGRWLEREHLQRADVSITETFQNLSYNSQELFFLAYAQLWCEDEKSEIPISLETDFQPDLHTPARIRINAALSNFPTFSQVFKCDRRENAAMNPVLKCSLF